MRNKRHQMVTVDNGQVFLLDQNYKNKVFELEKQNSNLKNQIKLLNLDKHVMTVQIHHLNIEI